MAPGIRPFAQIRDRRFAMLDGGWRPIAVHAPCSPYVDAPGKQPVKRWGDTPEEKNWRLGHSEAQLGRITPYTSNTGILCEALRVFDLDIDDPAIGAAVQAILAPFVPTGALVRLRQGSPRTALIVRADGRPGKLAVEGERGKVEVLGDGQQVLVDGEHPSGGRWYFDGAAPWDVTLVDIPVMPEKTVAAALQAIATSELLGPTITRSGDATTEWARLQQLKTSHRGDIAATAEALLAEASEGNRHTTLVTAAGYLVAMGWSDDEAAGLMSNFTDGWEGRGWDYHVDKAVAHARNRTTRRQGRWILPGGNR